MECGDLGVFDQVSVAAFLTGPDISLVPSLIQMRMMSLQMTLSCKRQLQAQMLT